MRQEISNSNSCFTTPAGANGDRGTGESKRARESETQWRLCDSNGPLVKSGEREQNKKRAGNHWWCMKKKSLRKVDMLGKIQSAPSGY